MIDLHCHILPGLDDGPEFLEEAVAMCRTAVSDGITCIVATPHYKPGTYAFSGERIAKSIAALTAAIRNTGLDIRILPGAEVTISPELSANLKEGGHLALNRGRYFLAEFSPLSVPPGWDVFLLSFLHNGLIPIIAHPERNAWFVRHPEALAASVESGARLQITAMSLTGAFGIEARDFCIHLLRRNLVHVIASDAHSADFRPPKLSEAVSLAADILGRPQAEALVTTNPQSIIENRPIPTTDSVLVARPANPHRRNWFQRLKDFNLAAAS